MTYKVQSIEVQVTRTIRYTGEYCSKDCDFFDGVYGGCERCNLRKVRYSTGDDLVHSYDSVQDKFKRTKYCLNIVKKFERNKCHNTK